MEAKASQSLPEKFTVGDRITATFKPKSPDRFIFQDEASLIGQRCVFVAVDQDGELFWHFEEPRNDSFYVRTEDLKGIQFLGNTLNEGESK